MKRLLFITLGVLIMDNAYAVDTCVRTTFNVTYSCGDGTLVGTLPENQVVEYGTYLKPTAISSSACTPPDGCKVSTGWSFYFGDKEEITISATSYAFYTFTSSSTSQFYYYYTDDLVITPKYLCESTTTASIDDLVLNFKYIDTSEQIKSYNEDTMTWSESSKIGLVRGIARKNNIIPLRKSNGYIPPNQSEIENSENGSGTYCYCKMTEPYLEDNPWVYYGTVSSSNSCSQYCVNSIDRVSLYAAAINAIFEQSQTE